MIPTRVQLHHELLWWFVWLTLAAAMTVSMLSGRLFG